MTAPGAVLFACGLNRIRSPMAASLMRRLNGPAWRIESCGLRIDPEAWPDPFVAAVMEEIGASLGEHAPKTFEDLAEQSFDVIVSLSAEAHERALEFARGRQVVLECWPTPDPTLASGSRETILGAYRDVRDSLTARIRERFHGVGA
ncbi:MAG: low molecular weight phosphatase family protein [Caulobacteraceae bacterium]